ncbi:MAG: histidine--tRNA ligase [Firmicutes bacterium]|nr:histidine--tRNA ligase [Bacillota bacterium]
MIIQNVKGGYDFLPKEQKIRNYINGILKNTFEEYGYLPIETPILCYFDMLAGKYDESNDILKEIYKLKDQGDRNLGLRYDLTVPFAKFIALNKNELKLPFKRYEINKVFRDGPVKVGRDREFTQCDVDVVGLSNQMIEAELISLYVNAFTKLNIEINIKYNSRNLMKGLILDTGVSEDLVSSTITIIDKIDKLTKEELTNNLLELGLNETQTKSLLEYFKLSLEELNIKFQNTTNEDIKRGLEELNNLEEYITKMNLKEYCTFTSSLARGQDYYTGNVFEVYEKNGLLSGAIGGGGRYDKMITEFINDGETYPAVGISFGLTSIFELLKNREEFASSSPIDIYVIPMGTNIESLKLANELRKLDIKVDLEMNNKKLKKSLDFCNKENIPYVIILGEDEIANNSFKLKDMINKEEYLINMNELDKVKDILN